MPTRISTGKAHSEVASQWIGASIIPIRCSVTFTMPYSSLKAQRHTMAVMVNETDQGSITMVRATPRP